MAAKSSNLEDRMSGANLQTEGHVDMPSQSAKGPKGVGSIRQFSLPLAILAPSQEAIIEPP